MSSTTRRRRELAAWQAPGDAARAALAADPGSPVRRCALQRAERLAHWSQYYDVAREFGAMVGRAGADPRCCRTIIMTGGGPGIMEAANRGAWEAGARSAGLNIELPLEQRPNAYLTPGLRLRCHYFAIRKLHFMLRARALVALPGGFGTLDEVFESLTLIQTRRVQHVPVILVGEAYWRRLLDVQFLVDEGMIDAQDRELILFAETAADIWRIIVDWYRENGEQLFCDGD
ncbi:MAG: TIGR00730 family Rossman fold protein [Gammaproteobacteria bacterium]|nr:TIGR00730 family Rossman fold protein [Gammaproteobacteria bacterium]